MAHTLKINVNGSNTIDMGAGTNYSVSQFVPRHPKQNDFGEYDLVTPIEDEIEVVVIGSSADNLLDQISTLDRVLHNAVRYYKDKNSGFLTELVWQPQGATNPVTTEVVGGWVEYPDDFLDAQYLARIVEKVKVHVVHRPIWEGATLTSGTDFTITTNYTNNGALNYMVLPALKGDIDARCRIKYIGASGDVANVSRIIGAVRANHSPANFIHILKVANVSGYSVTVDPSSTGSIALSAQAQFLSAQKLRFTPASDDVGLEVPMARWTISSNVADQYGRFLVLLRYRDTASSPNFRIRFRGGLSDGTNIMEGAYTTDERVRTRYNGSSTTTLGLLDLGLLNVPALGNPIATNKNLIYELLVEPLSTSGVLDVDYVQLLPIGEMDDGNGIELADFQYGFSTNHVFLDSRLRQERAYVSDGSDNKMFSPTVIPSGGEIRLRPQSAGQRVYLNVCRSSDDSLHDITITGTVTFVYVPQYVRVKGTN